MLLVANSGGATGSVCRVFSGRRCYRTEPDTYSLPPYMTCQTSVSFHHHFFPRIDFIPGGLRRRDKIVSSRPDDGKRRHLAQILRSFRDVEERASNTEHGRQQPCLYSTFSRSLLQLLSLTKRNQCLPWNWHDVGCRVAMLCLANTVAMESVLRKQCDCHGHARSLSFPTTITGKRPTLRRRLRARLSNTLFFS